MISGLPRKPLRIPRAHRPQDPKDHERLQKVRLAAIICIAASIPVSLIADCQSKKLSSPPPPSQSSHPS